MNSVGDRNNKHNLNCSKGRDLVESYFLVAPWLGRSCRLRLGEQRDVEDREIEREIEVDGLIS